MIKNKYAAGKFSLFFVSLMAVSGISKAQESAYADLDACTKDQQIKLTAKGAVTGLLAGFGGAFLAGKKDDAVKVAAIGAAAGGAAGFATAYYTAIETCQKLNANWITESKLVRDPSKSYAQVMKENNYKAKDGIKLLTKNIGVPSAVKAGSSLPIESTFDVMTPDGAETSVVIDHKLYVMEDGTEKLIYPKETKSPQRRVEAGRNTDSGAIPIASEVKAGTVYRVEFSVTPSDGKPVAVSKNVTIS